MLVPILRLAALGVSSFALGAGVGLIETSLRPTYKGSYDARESYDSWVDKLKSLGVTDPQLRDMEVMAWRCLQDPILEYSFFKVKSTKILLEVYRLYEKEKDQIKAFEYYKQNIKHIYPNMYDRMGSLRLDYPARATVVDIIFITAIFDVKLRRLETYMGEYDENKQPIS